MNKHYQVCTRCVMDTSALDITFDDNGICNYCNEFVKNSGHILHKDPAQRKQEFDGLVAKVKAEGRGKPYDCVIGVSGGVDSSWVLLEAVKSGLRPLAVHMDNGWNSELAQNNIANLVSGLGVDLHTHVIDWVEYRKLMQAFFDADVIDVELLYDNAMLAVNYRLAAKYGVKYILAGTNQSTEGMRMPLGWNWYKRDKKNIQMIGRKFGNVTLKTYPAISTLGHMWFRYVQGINWVSLLDYTEYNKLDAMTTLNKGYGYKPYPYKHYESIFTRFYQGYILPEKFHIDKRRVHLGTLVVSGQMSRDDALRKLEQIPYPSNEELEDDKQYFLKKMNWTKEKLAEYLVRPAIPHQLYGTEKDLFNRLAAIKNFIRS